MSKHAHDYISYASVCFDACRYLRRPPNIMSLASRAKSLVGSTSRAVDGFVGAVGNTPLVSVRTHLTDRLINPACHHTTDSPNEAV